LRHNRLGGRSRRRSRGPTAGSSNTNPRRADRPAAKSADIVGGLHEAGGLGRTRG
jgi:hypothetical protein